MRRVFWMHTPHTILGRWRDHFSQLLNIYRVNYVRHTEIWTAEPLVPNATACEFEVTFEELKTTNITIY
jgi:hypothetical protein